MMSESEFERAAVAALAGLESALERCDADVDVEAKGDGVIEVEFRNGSKLIINRHSAAREIWVAAKSGGFHFRWDGQAWVDTRAGEALPALVARLVSEQSGQRVVLDM